MPEASARRHGPGYGRTGMPGPDAVTASGDRRFDRFFAAGLSPVVDDGIRARADAPPVLEGARPAGSREGAGPAEDALHRPGIRPFAERDSSRSEAGEHHG